MTTYTVPHSGITKLDLDLREGDDLEFDDYETGEAVMRQLRAKGIPFTIVDDPEGRYTSSRCASGSCDAKDYFTGALRR